MSNMRARPFAIAAVALTGIAAGGCTEAVKALVLNQLVGFASQIASVLITSTLQSVIPT